jgi:predicted ATPase
MADKNAETASILAGLASRSLLLLSQSKLGTRYRLLNTARNYARDRLAEAGEIQEARRRHAVFFLQTLQDLKDGHFDQSLSKILTSEIDDVLAALIWDFTPEHASMPCHRVLDEAKNFGRSVAEASIG